ncbi:hypothetical protein R1flu_001419 [Riccia fluitans]|uniref:Uncharacterized protein n=1 Tax=Riccia fluitans TaxID=41844 RepID=A0ABD1Y783_9MARC
MDDDGTNSNEHSKTLDHSLRRIAEVIKSMSPNHEYSVIAKEVVNLIRRFKIIGRSYADQVVMKIQEVNVLKMKKQMLEKKLDLLRSKISSVLPDHERVIVPQDAVKLDVLRQRAARPEQQLRVGGTRNDKAVVPQDTCNLDVINHVEPEQSRN